MKKVRRQMPRRCWLCGRNGCADPLDKHHIFGGPFRGKSERYGLWVYLCHDRWCHESGKNAVHRNAETAQILHEYGQRRHSGRSAAVLKGGESVQDVLLIIGWVCAAGALGLSIYNIFEGRKRK